MEKILVTIDEAARQLSMSRATIYELMGDGSLKSVKIGRARRITQESLKTFVERSLPVSPAAND